MRLIVTPSCYSPKKWPKMWFWVFREFVFLIFILVLKVPIFSFGWNCEGTNSSMFPHNSNFGGWERYASLTQFALEWTMNSNSWGYGLCKLGGCPHHTMDTNGSPPILLDKVLHQKIFLLKKGILFCFYC